MKTGRDAKARGSRGRPDPWQSAIYSFEDSWPEACADSLTIKQCEVLIRLACAAYGVTAPPVKFDPKAKISYCYADGSGIFLIATQRNKFVALHEVTHHIVDRIYGSETEDHGYEFQSIYFFLLAHAEIAPECALRASVRERGILWRTAGPEDVKRLTE